MRKIKYLSLVFVLSCLILFASCKKLLEIAPPINTVTTVELFTNNKQAEWAVAGIYSKMIHGTGPIARIRNAGQDNFAAALSTIMGSYSSDDLYLGSLGIALWADAFQGKIKKDNSRTAQIWNTAYKVVYDATAAIEGLEASTATALADSVKKQLIGEALVLRAFSYFYLVNFFGDLPIVLSTDFNKTASLTRSPVTKVYDQIMADLVKAVPLLSQDLSVGRGQRIRVNRWVAEALMARVHLYTGKYQQAIDHATAVIDQPLFSIEQNLDNVFRTTSKEAILQLKPSAEEAAVLANTTPEALMMYIIPVAGPASYQISSPLFDAFELNDKRKLSWITATSGGNIPSKYKPNAQISNYTVIRLAEMYLIRAEARLLLNAAAKDDAIDDLNVLRRRADVTELDHQLTAEQVKAAVAHERRVELFCEWGHRWLDLKRTGKAGTALSELAWKQPWWGDFQLLYPIPPDEITRNGNLVQNPEYDAR